MIDFIHLLEAVTGLILALAWPLLVGAVIYKFREQVKALLNGIRMIRFGGVEAEIASELNKSADQAAPGLSSGPSKEELRGAAEVEDLAKHDVALIRQQVSELAFEYDNLRGLLPSGDKRTSLLEKVLSKMRTIGLAAYRIRYELKASPSPGHRLQAVACLQVLPDLELLDWLARCVREERRFIGYHALIALIAAADHPHVLEYLDRLETAARESAKGLPEGSERWNVWRQLTARIDSLRNRAQAADFAPAGEKVDG